MGEACREPGVHDHIAPHEERPLRLPSEYPTSTSGSSSSSPGRAADITCMHAVHTSSRAAILLFLLYYLFSVVGVFCL